MNPLSENEYFLLLHHMSTINIYRANALWKTRYTSPEGSEASPRFARLRSQWTIGGCIPRCDQFAPFRVIWWRWPKTWYFLNMCPSLFVALCSSPVRLSGRIPSLRWGSVALGSIWPEAFLSHAPIFDSNKCLILAECHNPPLSNLGGDSKGWVAQVLLGWSRPFWPNWPYTNLTDPLLT